MKDTATPRTIDPTAQAGTALVNHRGKFTAVRDSRNRRVPALYQRNGRFYCQLWVDRGNGRKAPRRFMLTNAENLPVRNLQEAKEALERKRNDRREEALPTLGRKPLFVPYSETYLTKATVLRKRPGTVENEQQALLRWRAHLGHVRIDRITTPTISAFVDKRLKGGAFGRRTLAAASERTVNLDLMVLRNVLKAAIDDGFLRELPRPFPEWYDHEARPRIAQASCDVQRKAPGSLH